MLQKKISDKLVLCYPQTFELKRDFPKNVTSDLLYTCSLYIVTFFASVMCGYCEEDWTEICKQAEVCYALSSTTVSRSVYIYICYDPIHNL